MRVLCILAIAVMIGICMSAFSQVAASLQAGEEARNFSLTATTGETVSLEEFKDKSIVVICIGNPYT